MPTIPINITGGSYESRSRSLTAQKTQGFYPEAVDNNSAKSKYVLHSWPGLKSFVSSPEKDRGMYEFQGVLYKVSGETLYSVDADGALTTIGTITGAGRCVFEGIGNDLIIVSEGKVWFLTVSDSISDISYSLKSHDLSANLYDGFNENNTSMVDIHPDGDKIWLGGYSNGRIYQFSMETPYDLSRISYEGQFVLTSQDTQPEEFRFSADGTKFYMAGDTNDRIFEYTVTTAHTLSGATYSTNSLLVSGQMTTLRSFSFSSDGTVLLASPLAGLYIDAANSKLYCGSGSNTIYQYNLTTAWDISTASYSGKSYAVTGSGAIINRHSIVDLSDISKSTDDSVSFDTSSEVTTMFGFTFSSNLKNLYVTDSISGIFYQYNFFGEVTDADLETPNAVAHLNNQAIYDGDNARWCSSDVGDATSITAANYATAESSPDNLLRPYVYNQVLYLFGEKTTETWYNSGVGNPPFDRIEGGIYQIGLGAIYSTAHNDNGLYFVGDDNRVYRFPAKQPVSDGALLHEFESYSVISDAVGICYSFENQNFYQISFPSENKTWVYSENTNQWIELQSNGGRYFGNSHAYAYRKNLLADYRNGNIYELDIDTYLENGEYVERIRDTGPIHGELLGAPGKRITMNRLELIMEVGVGTLPNTADNREDPQILLSFSDDGGKTYSTEMAGTIGKMGQYQWKVEWHGLGSFYSRNIRVKITDPVYCSIHSAHADMEAGI